MDDVQPAAYSIANRKPNHFFSESPFRSWMFLINTVLVGAICAAVIAILWKRWDKLAQHSSVAGLFLLTMLVQNVVYPYWWAIIRHRKINRLYLDGSISEQPAGSPVDELLSVADNSINEGLRNTMFCFGLFLLGLVLWHLS
jgi:cytochrome bd-type quinol oxidase subunit 2